MTRVRGIESAVRLVNIGLVGLIVYVVATTLLSFFETKPLAAIAASDDAPPPIDLAAIGEGLRFVPAPAASTTTTTDADTIDRLELTALLIDPADEKRALAVFADQNGSVTVAPDETIRPGFRFLHVEEEGAVVSTSQGDRRLTLKKSVPPAAAYIAEATPVPTPTPEPPENVITDDPEGTIIRKVWPSDEEA